MFSNSCRFIFIPFFTVLLLIFCAKSLFASEPFESTVHAPYFRLLESLTNEKRQNINSLLMQWEGYVASVSTYSVADYAGAIQMLQEDYSKSLVQLELCLDDGKKMRKNQDPAWFVRLVDHFGVDYLMEKEKSIYDNVGMILAGSEQNCCGNIMEGLFYKEMALYGAYRDFFSRFLDFYTKQPAEVQELLKSRKNEVDNFMKLIDRISIVKVMTAGGLHRRQLSEAKAKRSDKAIYEYFKANPPGCDIDPFKAMEEFRKAMKATKMQ